MAGITERTTPVEMVPVLPPRKEKGDQTIPLLAEDRYLIRNIDWSAYRKISEALDNRHFHMSYDGKDLELMTTSDEHEQCSRLLGDFVLVLTEETGQPRRSCGGMTMDRKDLEKGIEADESYYMTNEPSVRGKKIDVAVDPPPDLGIEVDLTTDSRRRLGIYSKIGIPEIWRYDGESATIYQRQPDGQYQIAESSRYFPFLAPADLARSLAQRRQTDETILLRSFRQWVRSRLEQTG